MSPVDLLHRCCVSSQDYPAGGGTKMVSSFLSIFTKIRVPSVGPLQSLIFHMPCLDSVVWFVDLVVRVQAMSHSLSIHPFDLELDWVSQCSL